MRYYEPFYCIPQLCKIFNILVRIYTRMNNCILNFSTSSCKLEEASRSWTFRLVARSRLTELNGNYGDKAHAPILYPCGNGILYRRREAHSLNLFSRVNKLCRISLGPPLSHPTGGAEVNESSSIM